MHTAIQTFHPFKIHEKDIWHGYAMSNWMTISVTHFRITEPDQHVKYKEIKYK